MYIDTTQLFCWIAVMCKLKSKGTCHLTAAGPNPGNALDCWLSAETFGDGVWFVCALCLTRLARHQHARCTQTGFARGAFPWWVDSRQVCVCVQVLLFLLGPKHLANIVNPQKKHDLWSHFCSVLTTSRLHFIKICECNQKSKNAKVLYFVWLLMVMVSAV